MSGLKHGWFGRASERRCKLNITTHSYSRTKLGLRYVARYSTTLGAVLGCYSSGSRTASPA